MFFNSPSLRCNSIPILGQLQSELDCFTCIFQVDCKVLISRDDGGFINEDSKVTTVVSGDNVSFCLFPNISNFKSLFFIDSKLSYVVSQLVAEHQAVIARLPSEIGLLLINEAIRQNKPYAIEMVGCPYDALTNHGSIKARLYAPFAAYRTRKAVRDSGFVTYVTNNFLQKRYPCVNGITESFSDVLINNLDPQILNNRLIKISNGSSPLVIGIIANYSAKYKGIDIAIKALSILKNDLPPFEFRILGSGDSTQLSVLAANCGLKDFVFFDAPRSSGDAVNNWLDNVDLYLQPSLTEGLPRALIEAKSRACPALGTNVGGISELLPLDKLTEPGEVYELALLLTKLVNDKDAMMNSATRNFNDSSEFTFEKLNEKRNKFWSSFKDKVLQ